MQHYSKRSSHHLQQEILGFGMTWAAEIYKCMMGYSRELGRTGHPLNRQSR